MTVRRRGTDVVAVAFMLPASLALPVLAVWPLLQRHGVEWLAVWGGASVVSFVAYAVDKHAATFGQARLPEAGLLLLDALGGWPGGFVAQRLLRHKTAKLGYQFSYWLIVAAHQGAAAWWLFG